MIKKINSPYKFLWGNYQSLLTVEMNLKPFKQLREIDWNQASNIIEVVEDNKIRCFHSISDLQKDTERGKKFLDTKYADNFIGEIEKNYKQSWKLFSKLKRTNYKNLADDKLYALLLEAIKQWGVQISYFRASQVQAEYYLIKNIKKYFTDSELSSFLVSPELDIINKETIDWEKIVNRPYSRNRVIEHVEKYPWVVAVHFSLNDVLKTMKHRYNIANKLKHKIHDIVEEKRQLKKRQEKLLRKANSKTKKIILLLQKLVLTRASIKSCWAGMDYYIIPLLEEISRRTGVEIHDLGKYYLSVDIKKVLQGEKLPDTEKEDRKRCFVGLWKNGKITYASGDNAERLARRELKELYGVEKEREIKGAVANKGKVVSVARVLESNNMEQARKFRDNFKKGQVLVTQMTQPNIVDIASRAGAIITDEGGMLSHAAIISREFKIPCIVGTHIVTSVIKDGDLVEVDANKGIVKIIKKAK